MYRTLLLIGLMIVMQGLLVSCESGPEAGKFAAVKGEEYFKNAKYAKAIKEYTKALQYDEKNGHLYYMLAVSHALEGNIDEAYSYSEAYYKARTVIDVSESEDYQKALTQQIIDVYVDAKLIEPSKAEMLDEQLKKLYDKLEGSYDKLSADELVKKGDEQFNAFNFEQAIRYYELALAREPDNYTALLNLGSIYVSNQASTEAVKYLEKAVKIKPEASETYEWLCLAYKNTARKKEADQCYAKMQEMEGN